MAPFPPPPPPKKLKPSQVAVVSESPPRLPTPTSSSSSFHIEARNLCYRPPSAAASSFRRRFLPSSAASSAAASPPLILDHVSCSANSGEILAVVGPSGAGKSTLLELLAGRLRPSSPPDSILANGRPIDAASFRRLSGYVPQEDALFPLLTVRETLAFSAMLRLGSGAAAAAAGKKVAELLRELKLEHVADARVGGGGSARGISGGERRRVSIGVEVIHDPAVLLLDEPTSGLDSAAALHVVDMLHAMARRRRRTIILSIHQPSFRILALIDSFLLLASGSVAHHGSLAALRQSLAASGHRIPPHVNVLEYAIEAISDGILGHDHHRQQVQPIDDEDAIASQYCSQLCCSIHVNAAGWDSTYSQIDVSDAISVHRHCAAADKSQLPPPPAADSQLRSSDFSSVDLRHVPDAAPSGSYANGPIAEVGILSGRLFRNLFRSHELFLARTAQALLGGIAMGTIYMNAGGGDEGIRKRLGFFAFTLTYLLSSTVEALPVYLAERAVVVAEMSRGAYRAASYVAANAVVFLPFLLLVALLYAAPVYGLIGLGGGGGAAEFAFFVASLWAVLMMANSFVAFFGAMVPDYIMGSSLIAAAMGAFFLFSGYFIAPQEIPPYWRFMHYLSLFKYPLDALLVNEFDTQHCFDATAGGGGDAGGGGAPPCLLTGARILEQLRLSPSSKWPNFAVMILFVVSYRILCYFVLRFRVRRRLS